MTTSSENIRASPFAIFRKRNFALVWIGQLVSTIGTALTSLAASIVVYRLTGSALSVGLMLMATAAPSLLVGLIAGVFVDRFDRKRIMIIADLIRAGLVVLIPFLIPIHVAWLYILVMLTSAIGQFFDPAHASVLPEIASDEELAAANSFIAISAFGSTAIGFAASGLIASQFPIEWAFYLDAFSFILSALCILFVKIPPLEVEGKTNIATVIGNLREGVSFLYSNIILRSLVLVSVPILLGFGLWNSLLLPFATRALNATEFEFGLQEGLTSVGFVIGSLMMARIADRLREGQWLAIGFLGMAVVGIFYSRTASIPIAIGLVTVSGFMNAPSAIARRLLVQRNAPREVRGRVNSAFFVTRDIIFLMGMAAAGLADLVDVRILILGSALLMLASGLLALVLPGLGQPAADWKKALSMLRAAPVVPELGVGRAATLADLDKLVAYLPALSGLSSRDREAFIEGVEVRDAPAGTTILRQGETGEEAFFIIAGKAVAGVASDEGRYRSLSVMDVGDFFGEIAALTGRSRTANVVAEEDISLMQVPAVNLRGLMKDPRLMYLFWSKLIERLSRTHAADLPRLAGWDQESLRELRMPQQDEATTGT